MLLIFLSSSLSFFLGFEFGPVSIYIQALVWSIAYVKFLEENTDLTLVYTFDKCRFTYRHWSETRDSSEKLDLELKRTGAKTTNIIPQGYKLDFVDYSDEWLGCWSSMAKGHSSDYLWGVVWELNKSDMEMLNVYGSINTDTRL